MTTNIDLAKIYKGKDVKTGEWVQGLLFTRKAPSPFSDAPERYHAFIIPEPEDSFIDEHYGKLRLTATIAQVDPATVCESTGLSYADGGMIWENEIVEYPSHYMEVLLRGVVRKGDLSAFRQVVVGDGRCQEFYVEWLGEEAKQLRNDLFNFAALPGFRSAGNIFDNADLLG